MRPVEKALQKLGYDTEAPTLAGHGASNDAMLNASWKEWIESGQQAFDRLSSRVDQVVVCGLSMGGSISCILAGRSQKVAGLIMLSPTLQYDSPELDVKPHLRIFKIKMLRDFLHVLVALFPIIGKKVYWTETPPYGLKDERLQRQITKAIEAAKRGEETKFGLFRTYWISMWQMNYITDHMKKSAPAVKCPTLIVSSLEDTLVSINNATDTYSMLGTHDKSLTMLTGCDHVLTLDLKRNYVSSLVCEFMEALTGVSSQPVANTDMELSIEIHNRLNPLSNGDWTQLVPGAPDLGSLVERLQKENTHEHQCHTLVVRHKNVPALMVPMIIDRTSGTSRFAFPADKWGASPERPIDQLLLQQTWLQVERVREAMTKSFAIRRTDFFSLEAQKQRLAHA
jgi:carboxylesterase